MQLNFKMVNRRIILRKVEHRNLIEVIRDGVHVGTVSILEIENLAEDQSENEIWSDIQMIKNDSWILFEMQKENNYETNNGEMLQLCQRHLYL